MTLVLVRLFKTIGNRWFLGHSSRHGRGVFALRDGGKKRADILFDDDDDEKNDDDDDDDDA